MCFVSLWVDLQKRSRGRKAFCTRLERAVCLIERAALGDHVILVDTRIFRVAYERGGVVERPGSTA